MPQRRDARGNGAALPEKGALGGEKKAVIEGEGNGDFGFSIKGSSKTKNTPCACQAKQNLIAGCRYQGAEVSAKAPPKVTSLALASELGWTGKIPSRWARSLFSTSARKDDFPDFSRNHAVSDKPAISRFSP